MTQAQPPPGWYPNGPGLERWWDGHQWGPQVRAMMAPQVTYPQKSVARVPNHTSHAFHLIMTLITFGLWLPVWIVMTILNRVSRRKVVTRYR